MPVQGNGFVVRRRGHNGRMSDVLEFGSGGKAIEAARHFFKVHGGCWDVLFRSPEGHEARVLLLRWDSALVGSRHTHRGVA